jgi:NADH:ubiquinone oxidoreductase subunit 5 (subunit L)/multisubunit Na+/H+ antiporter MnhA subunit
MMPFLSLALVALVALPAMAVIILALSAWFGARLSEHAINRLVGFVFWSATFICFGLGAWMLINGREPFEITIGDYFVAKDYHFHLTLTADGLSIPYVTLSSLLVGVIAAFSRRYLHREPGYQRFFFLLCLFGAATNLVALAGTLDLLFFGWEIVGLSSALLIAFFHEREKPVEHGFRAFVTYRLCDIGLLAAAVWMHHTMGTSTVQPGVGEQVWHGFPVPASTFDATLIGLLILWASMGKSGQIPLGGWLPRAMEGPTPSSAIFYGAISIHLGPYLLFRAAPILEAAPIVAFAVIAIGGLTALHATFVGRVQTDIKSALAYASMTQVGLIFVEIGLGWRTLAILHIVSHAVIRSLQILRSPGLLQDHGNLVRSMGAQLPRTGGHLEYLVPVRYRAWLYRLALERGYFDVILREQIVARFVHVVRSVDALDRRWAQWLAGPREPSANAPTTTNTNKLMVQPLADAAESRMQ